MPWPIQVCLPQITLTHTMMPPHRQLLEVGRNLAHSWSLCFSDMFSVSSLIFVLAPPSSPRITCCLFHRSMACVSHILTHTCTFDIELCLRDLEPCHLFPSRSDSLGAMTVSCPCCYSSLAWLKVNTKHGWIQKFLMPTTMPGTLSYGFYHGEDTWGHLRVKWRPYDSSGPTLRCFFQLLLTVPVTRHKTNTIFSLVPIFLVPWVHSCARFFSFWFTFLWMCYLHFHPNMPQNDIVSLIFVLQLTLFEAQVQGLFFLLSQQVFIHLCFY